MSLANNSVPTLIRRFVLALTLGSASITAAQVTQGAPRPNTNPRVTLTVRVRLPNDRPVPIPAEVQVISSFGISLAETFTRDDGRAEIAEIPPGTYRIRVSGSGLESVTSDPFDIGDNDRTHFEAVTVRLISEGTSGGAPTVSSQEFSIPQTARDQMEKGMDSFSRGNMQDATAQIQKAIQIFPGYALAYNNLGVVFISQGDKTSAEKAFQKSIEVDDHFVPGYINLARISASARGADAMSFLQKALSIDPNNLDALALLARLQFNQGDFASSLGTVQRVHSLPHEHYADVHLISAEIYQKQNRNPEAIAESELYLKEYPGSPRAQQVRSAIEVIRARR